MGEESDHVHITALSDALGVPIRVVYLDRSSCDSGGASVNHHDFIPTPGDCPNANSGSTKTTSPFITLLYRPGHYDILYPKWCTCWFQVSLSSYFESPKPLSLGQLVTYPIPFMGDAKWAIRLVGAWKFLSFVFGSSAFPLYVKMQENCIHLGRNKGTGYPQRQWKISGEPTKLHPENLSMNGKPSPNPKRSFLCQDVSKPLPYYYKGKRTAWKSFSTEV